MKPYTADRATNFGAYHIYDYALGFIAGWGAHPLDIAQWGLGTDDTGPVRYQGTGKIPPKGSLWDSIESWDVQCEYANGVKMHFMGQPRRRAGRQGLSPRLVRPWHDLLRRPRAGSTSTAQALYASDKALQKAQIKPEEKHLTEAASQARDFVDCIKSRKPTVSPLESAIRSDTISHLSDLCIRLGRPVAMGPAEGTDRRRRRGDSAL